MAKQLKQTETVPAFIQLEPGDDAGWIQFNVLQSALRRRGLDIVKVGRADKNQPVGVAEPLMGSAGIILALKAYVVADKLKLVASELRDRTVKPQAMPERLPALTANTPLVEIMRRTNDDLAVAIDALMETHEALIGQ